MIGLASRRIRLLMACGGFSAAVYGFMVRPWLLDLGSTDDERHPGWGPVPACPRVSRSSGAPFPSREMTNPALPLNRRWRLAMTGQSVSSSGGTPLTTSHSAKQTSAIRPGLELRRDPSAANYRLVLLAVARAT